MSVTVNGRKRGRPPKGQPVYLRCAAEIRQRMRRGQYKSGEFIPSERDLSREFDVARLTIRKSLAELAREGLLESVPGSGNRVREVRTSEARTMTLCCVTIRNDQPLSLSPFYADIFSGIEREAAVRGYRIMFRAYPRDVLWTGDPVGAAEALAERGGFDGVIGIDGIPDEFIEALRSRGRPVALADRETSEPDVSWVMPDNLQGAKQAVRHLLELGHRRILYLSAPEDPVVRARREGLERAFAEAGLSWDPKLEIRGNYLAPGAEVAVRQYLDRVSPATMATAIFAVNDESAIGAMKKLRARCYDVPEAVSVMGFDDIGWAQYAAPPLSTVRVQREEMGRIAAGLLVDRLSSEASAGCATRLKLQTELVLRESCAQPRHKRG